MEELMSGGLCSVLDLLADFSTGSSAIFRFTTRELEPSTADIVGWGCLSPLRVHLWGVSQLDEQGRPNT